MLCANCYRAGGIIDDRDAICPSWDSKVAIVDEIDSAVKLKDANEATLMAFRNMLAKHYLPSMACFLASGTKTLLEVKPVYEKPLKLDEYKSLGAICQPSIWTVKASNSGKMIDGFAVQFCRSYVQLNEENQHIMASTALKGVCYTNDIEDTIAFKKTADAAKFVIKHSDFEKRDWKKRFKKTLGDTRPLRVEVLHSRLDKERQIQIVSDMRAGGNIDVVSVVGMFGRGAGGTNIGVSIIISKHVIFVSKGGYRVLMCLFSIVITCTDDWQR